MMGLGCLFVYYTDYMHCTYHQIEVKERREAYQRRRGPQQTFLKPFMPFFTTMGSLHMNEYNSVISALIIIKNALPCLLSVHIYLQLVRVASGCSTHALDGLSRNAAF